VGNSAYILLSTLQIPPVTSSLLPSFRVHWLRPHACGPRSQGPAAVCLWQKGANEHGDHGQVGGHCCGGGTSRGYITSPGYQHSKTGLMGTSHDYMRHGVPYVRGIHCLLYWAGLHHDTCRHVLRVAATADSHQEPVKAPDALLHPLGTHPNAPTTCKSDTTNALCISSAPYPSSHPFCPLPPPPSYKYIVALDGQAAPTGTVARALFSGSLLLRQESPWQEFFYTGLRPYEHYVPLSYSAGDIVQQVGRQEPCVPVAQPPVCSASHRDLELVVPGWASPRDSGRPAPYA
jgi:hypothetical protein